ncbi:HEAT repeat domain-containing protein [Streptomyces ovatisporus]|uniref:HEAT repeat domain-containing protein n=1 Tax=Streptomyces ovatisporus TaxID=1128682 RepID=A0ABV9A8L0_9ACTN
MPYEPTQPQPDAPAHEWVRYDLSVRRVHDWFPQPGTAPERVRAQSVALCHGDGRVREAALRSGVPDGLLPLVILRCADWAEPVREAARDVLAEASGGALVAVADTVLRLSARRHGGYAAELLEARLADGEQALRQRAFTHRSRRVRRWVFRLAADGGWLTSAGFAEAAVRDTDVIVQEVCAAAALAANPVPEDVHDRLLAARATRVRAAAVTALRRSHPCRSHRHLKAGPLLSDRAASVRACAQWVVRTADGEPVHHYRALLSQGREVTSGAVAGLGECGGKDDAALLRPLLQDPRTAVRAAAVGALHHLGAVDHVRLAPMLDDPSPAVVRRVVAALEPDASALPAGDLRTRLAAERPAHVRRAALRLLTAGSRGLTPLRAALTLVEDRDPALRARARALAARWSPPDAAALCAALPAAERALLAAELDRAAPSLGQVTVRLVRLMLRL